MIIPLIVAAIAAAQQPGTSTVKMSCALAAHVAISQAINGGDDTGPSVELREFSSQYSETICVESRKVNGRIFVVFVPGGLVRDGGLVYVIEPDLKARRVRGITCEDSPNPEVCE